MQIDTYLIDQTSKVFIVAEISANHNGKIALAKETILAAKQAGANAVKFQTYTADSITINSEKEDFFIKETVWDGTNLYALYKEACTPLEWHSELFEYCKSLGIICFSTPFDKKTADFLAELNCPAFKVASFEITDLNFISYVAKKGKPIILSTGIATKDEIKNAIETCRAVGNNDIVVLKCTSSYPAPPEEANLNMVRQYRLDFNVLTGLSDHTMGNHAPIIATCYGARIIEKHLILDRDLGGPDSTFSLSKEEFTEMVRNVRQTEEMMGHSTYELTPKQIKGRDFSRSIYAVENIRKGESFSQFNTRAIRPGFGLHPKFIDELWTLRSPINLEKGERITMEILKNARTNE
jgi:pseudaminic acid synthase